MTFASNTVLKASSVCRLLYFATQYKFCLLLFPMFGLLKILGVLGGLFCFHGVFLANHLSPLSLLKLPASVCSGCLYAVNSLSKSYFSFSQFYIVEVDFVTQKTPRENSNQKWHRQKVMGISEETETFLCHHHKK